MNNAQIVAIVAKFIEDNPVTRHKAVAYQITMAFIEAYGTLPRDLGEPCKIN